MNTDNWYRNVVWNKNTESHFNEKLKRVRLKQDFLRIQASYLTKNDPGAALSLLEQYFSFGVHFDLARAWYDRAVAYSAIEKTNLALEAFTMALQEEENNPALLTKAYLGLPILVADNELTASYPLALNILKRYEHRLVSHRDYFEWNAAYALILSAKGFETDATKYALEAIQAKQEHANGQKHHINVGTMPADDRYINIYNKVSLIAASGKPSLKHRISRMFSN
jgi:tetratricopeptide (TPR) repeat protein